MSRILSIMKLLGIVGGLVMLSIASLHVGIMIGTSIKQQRQQQQQQDQQQYRHLQETTNSTPIHPFLQPKVYTPISGDVQGILDFIRNGLKDNTGNTTLFTDILNRLPTTVSDITANDYSNDQNLPENRALSWILYGDSSNYHVEELIMSRYGLVYFYYHYDMNAWPTDATVNWLSADHHYCDWYGVTCCRQLLTSPVCANITTSNPDGIAEIDWYNRSIVGNITTPMFLLLSSDLQSIFLNENKLTGPIPEFFFTTQFPKLSKIYLQHNQFTGTLPQNRYNGVLNTLYIQGNNITGNWPTSFCRPNNAAKNRIEYIGLDCKEIFVQSDECAEYEEYTDCFIFS